MWTASQTRVPRPGRVLLRAFAWPWHPAYSRLLAGAPPHAGRCLGKVPQEREGRGTGTGRCRARPALCAAGPGSQGRGALHSLQPLLVSVLSDGTASPAARLHCASAWLGCYVAAADVQDLVSCLNCLEGVSAGRVVRVAPQPLWSPPACTACSVLPCKPGHCSTVCPSTHISHILDRQLPRLPQLLSSESVNLRIAAGETSHCSLSLPGTLRRILFMRTWRPSVAPCGPWPPTATNTVPRPTAGDNALPSAPCCTSLRVVSVRKSRYALVSRCSM